MPDGNYDRTNTGVFWRPHEDQKLAGQGKLDIHGAEARIVIIREPVKRDGEPQMVVYQKIGVLFPNDKKGNEKAPDFSGPIDGRQMRLAAWKGDKDGRPYMTLKASDNQRREGSDQDATGGFAKAGDVAQKRAADPFDDDVPF